MHRHRKREGVGRRRQTKHRGGGTQTEKCWGGEGRETDRGGRGRGGDDLDVEVKGGVDSKRWRVVALEQPRLQLAVQHHVQSWQGNNWSTSAHAVMEEDRGLSEIKNGGGGDGGGWAGVSPRISKHENPSLSYPMTDR